MQEKFQSDILIEGEGLTTVALAYFLSMERKEETINLVLRQQEEMVLSHFNPGIVLPVFQLPLPLMEKIYRNSIKILQDLNSLTSYFECSQNSLLMLYRDKKAIETMIKHQEKLESSKIRKSKLSTEEIESYHPFINTEKEIQIVEIYDSFTCSNPYELFIAFQKLAEENDVYIMRETKDIEISDKRSFSTDSTIYEANKLAITTSNVNFLKSNIQKKSILKLVTPIFERFPRISLVDLNNSSFMWLEEAGYFHIFRSISNDSNSNLVDKVKEDFSNIFRFSDSLEVLDSNTKDVVMPKDVSKGISYSFENDIYHFILPLHLEMSLSTAIAQKFSKLDDKKLNEKKENFTLESIF